MCTKVKGKTRRFYQAHVTEAFFSFFCSAQAASITQKSRPALLILYVERLKEKKEGDKIAEEVVAGRSRNIPVHQRNFRIQNRCEVYQSKRVLIKTLARGRHYVQ